MCTPTQIAVPPPPRPMVLSRLAKDLGRGQESQAGRDEARGWGVSGSRREERVLGSKECADTLSETLRVPSYLDPPDNTIRSDSRANGALSAKETMLSATWRLWNKCQIASRMLVTGNMSIAATRIQAEAS